MDKRMGVQRDAAVGDEGGNEAHDHQKQGPDQNFNQRGAGNLEVHRLALQPKRLFWRDCVQGISQLEGQQQEGHSPQKSEQPYQ